MKLSAPGRALGRAILKVAVPACLLFLLLGSTFQGCLFLDVLTGLYTGTYVEFQACKLDEEGQSCETLNVAHDICVQEKGVGHPECRMLFDQALDCIFCDFFFRETYLSKSGTASKSSAVPMIVWSERGSMVLRTADGGARIEELVDYGRWPLGVAVDPNAGKIYWTDGRSHSLRRANFDGSDVEDLVEDLYGSGVAIDAASQLVYFGNVSVGTIERLDLATLEHDVLISDVYRPIDVAFDPNANALYWTQSTGEGGSIQRFVIGASDAPETLLEGAMLPFALAIDSAARTLYWSEVGANAIRRISLDNPGNVTNVLTSLEVPGALAVDPAGGRLYFTEAQPARTSMASLSDPAGTRGEISGLFAVADFAIDPNGGHLYWSGWLTGSLGRVNLDGTSPQALIVRQALSGDVALDPGRGKVYWVVQTTGDVHRADLDGSNLEIILPGEFAVAAIAFDPASDKLYWNSGQRIRRSDADGSNAETVIPSGIVFLSDLEIDSQEEKIYWTDQSFIRRSNLDGSGPELWFTENNRVEHLALFGGTLYWTVPFENVIRRAPVDGSMQPVDVVTDVAFAQHVTTDGEKLYWSLPFEGRIQRSNLDGTGVEDVLVNVNGVGGIAIGIDRTVPIETPGALPTRALLSAPYPNPFIESTTFALELPRTQYVSIRVYDLLGRVVSRVHEGVLAASEQHPFTIEARGWPAGTYVFDVRGEDVREARTAILSR